jgi:acyl-CoA synthetase (AMP-forming)/AMP-acid ligase II
MTTCVGRVIEPLSGRAWSPTEIGRRLRGRRELFNGLGLTTGDRVFLHHGNTLEFFVDLLAVWHVGGCAIPIDPRLTRFEVRTLAEAARPKCSIWGPEPNGTLATDMAALGVTSITSSDEHTSTSTDQGPIASRLRLDNEALVLFTSGTTGSPKGIVHTHRSLRARWSSLASVLGLEPYRRTLCLLPTSFGHGLICNCLFPWLSGCDLHVLPPFRADLLVELGALIDEHEITFLSSVPTVWRLALKISRPPNARSLSRIHCGSAPLSASLWRSIQTWAGIADVKNVYGITETGSWLAGTTTGFEAPQDGFIGTMWGGDVRILPPLDATQSPTETEPCKPRDSGQIWVKTPALMKGYLGREDLTSAVTAGGWFCTGDIGFLDEQGHLYLRGREREEINRGGTKVYPGDIDAVVERFAGTLDVCAFAYSDPLLGEEVGVAVVLTAEGDNVLPRLYEWSREYLAVHQLPKRWYVLSEIPRTSRGKFNRAEVARHCERVQPITFQPQGKA